MIKGIFGLLVCLVFSHSISSMDLPRIENNQRETKEQTISKMIALAFPDFQKKYDEVTELDLADVLKTTSFMNYSRDERTLVINKRNQPEFTRKRILLKQIAEEKVFAPLIPVLFAKWPQLSNHWIARSMLYHAVIKDLSENTCELLAQGVDPNKPADNLFSSDQTESKVPVVDIAAAAWGSVEGPLFGVLAAVIVASSKKDPSIATKSFNHTVCNYLQVGGYYKDAIDSMLATGMIDPIEQKTAQDGQLTLEAQVKKYLDDRINDIRCNRVQVYIYDDIQENYPKLVKLLIEWKRNKKN